MNKQIISADCGHHARAGNQPESDVPATPDGILTDAHLSTDRKRELLASLASDRRAVADRPALRRAGDEAVFHIDDLLEALKSLDREDTGGSRDGHGSRPTGGRYRRRHRSPRDAWFINRIKKSGRDDDDDPPPCPVSGRPLGPAPLDGSIGALIAA